MAQQARDGWTDGDDIVSYMARHPNRAYFSRLFRDGRMRVGMEVGVADGRFSEHFLKDAGKRIRKWYMVEPAPNAELVARFPAAASASKSAAARPGSLARLWGWLSGRGWSWQSRGIGTRTKIVHLRHMSMDSQIFSAVPAHSVDFIYIDSSHLYDVTKKELKAFWRLLKRGGVLAGHDYCDHGESAAAAATGADVCSGCYPVPRCLPYTEYGLAHGKPGGVPSRSQTDVVKAVQEWVVQNRHRLHFTSETFTRSSLRADSMDYDLVITNSRNPSWFVVKGHGPDNTQHGQRNEVTVAELAGWRQPATAAQTTEMMLRPFASDLAVGVVSAPGRRYLRQALHSVLTGMAPEASPAQQQHTVEPQVPVHVFATTLFSKSQR